MWRLRQPQPAARPLPDDPPALSGPMLAHFTGSAEHLVLTPAEAGLHDPGDDELHQPA